jgi:prolyl-tRNA editing enzyme YbaK/EbsC (Cys-tRNA(Pro) deacylase)
VKLGNLDFEPIETGFELVSGSVKEAASGISGILVSCIDPSLADTAAFCEHYGIGMDVSANCVIVEAKRADKVWYAACIVLATTRADINGIVRKYLEARKVSFAPMEKAVEMTGMEYGGITPIGLPEGIPVMVDMRVTEAEYVVIGSGIRGSKLLVKPDVLVGLPGAVVKDIVKT